ncbi:MAG: hypothetical protein GX351_02935 [Peptococcaceae bacterium]|nr:hypothetical protein [Peptococcaceae bacterium]
MMFFSYICLLVFIILFWQLSDKLEWQPPAWLLSKLTAIRANREVGKCKVEIMEIQIAEFNHCHLEKEIYLLKKDNRYQKAGLALNLNIQLIDKTLNAEEKSRIKSRLEKRFPGLIVNFLPREQEREHASVCGS